MGHTLEQWLGRIEALHPSTIELGLARVKRVGGAMHLGRVAPLIVTVAGTNGKGSTVAFLEAIAREAGLRTGAYTSPHLLRYNERIRVDGRELADDEIVDSFERVEAARGDVPLTYFEFGTLAALHALKQRRVEMALLEVGLGGRLDAVNVVDADVAIVTSIGLDHLDWLGADRDAIGAEKAGVFRRGRPAIVGDCDPPASLLSAARSTGSRLLCYERDFHARADNDANTWSYESRTTAWKALPMPRFGGFHQLSNAACALAALEQLGHALRIDRADVVAGLETADAPGRTQIDTSAGDIAWVYDVAHNAEAAAWLAQFLDAQDCRGRTLAVTGLMQDKPVEAYAAALDSTVDAWWAVSAGGGRALSASACAQRLRAGTSAEVVEAGSVAAGLEAAAGAARPGDRIVVCGSFLVVGAALGRRAAQSGDEAVHSAPPFDPETK